MRRAGARVGRKRLIADTAGTRDRRAEQHVHRDARSDRKRTAVPDYANCDGVRRCAHHTLRDARSESDDDRAGRHRHERRSTDAGADDRRGGRTGDVGIYAGSGHRP